MKSSTEYWHLLTDAEWTQVGPHYPSEGSHRLTTAMIIWEWFLDDTPAEAREYLENAGYCQVRDDLAEFVDPLDLAWHLAPDLGGCFDWDFTPSFMKTLVVWDAMTGPSLHPQWLDCIRATLGSDKNEWVTPETLQSQQAERPMWVVFWMTGKGVSHDGKNTDHFVICYDQVEAETKLKGIISGGVQNLQCAGIGPITDSTEHWST